MAKAYRTVSHEALCIITGMTPIDLKIEESTQTYQANRANTNNKNFETDTTPINWQNPADAAIRTHKEEVNPIQIFTDGSKSERGVGSGFAVFGPGENIKTIHRRLNKNCTNNQAEQFAILSALEYIRKIEAMDKRATVFTDKQINLDRLQNNNIHSHVVEETRRKLTEVQTRGWKITLGWVKAHAGNWGNELADKLAKNEAFSKTIPESYSKIPKSVTIKEIE